MLGTIKLPKNLKQLAERLPSSQYGSRRRKSKLSYNNDGANAHSENEEIGTTTHSESSVSKKYNKQYSLENSRRIKGSGILKKRNNSI